MQPTTPSTPGLTPGQAHYVITRLLNERRLTTSDIAHYLNDLQHEITTITERLATLRTASNTPPATTAQRTSRNTTHRTTSHSTPSNRKRRTPSRTTRRTPSNTIPSNTPIPSNTTKARRHFSPAARAQQQLQGRYLGYMRQLPAYARPRFQAIKARDGYDAAITALKQHLGK
jgi:hypothetical protein